MDDPSKEKVAQHYIAFILQLLKCTQRPSKMKLAQARVDVFSVGKTEASKFAAAIVQIFQEARSKLKGYKTGEKNWQPCKRSCQKMLELSSTGDENVEDSQSLEQWHLLRFPPSRVQGEPSRNSCPSVLLQLVWEK